nr:isopenicillin N synthase family oxygenase [Acinetobacter sp. Marseille-Q1620]
MGYTETKNQKSGFQLPIIDLAQFRKEKSQQVFLKKLQDTAREIGFFYLAGHGISKTRIAEIEQLSRQFFALEQSKKDALSMHYSPHFRGYTKLNEELTRNQPDFREQIDIGADLQPVEFNESTPLWLRLQGPNLWPENWEAFRQITTAWQKDLRAVAIELLHALMLALEQPQDALDLFVNGIPNELLKLIHYPVVAGKNASRQGVGAHKDSGILTLLLQDRIGGLQVLHQDQWIDIPYVEDAFIINIGEILELATNGYLVANTHRVISPDRGIDRYSIAYFITPNLYAGEIPILALPEHLQKLASGPESDPLNPLLRNAGENTIKSRLRSHLAVTEKFYPDQYAEIISQQQKQQEVIE